MKYKRFDQTNLFIFSFLSEKFTEYFIIPHATHEIVVDYCFWFYFSNIMNVAVLGKYIWYDDFVCFKAAYNLS